MNQIKLFTVLTLFFIVLTEKLVWVNVLAGLVVSSVVIFLNRDSFLDFGKLSIKTSFLWIKFVVLLIKEVIVSNLQVARIALSRHMDINPALHTHQSRLTDPLLITIYANAITLTPGTMTVDIDGQRLSIHCLNDRYAKGLENSSLEKLLLDIEGGNHE